VCVCMVSREDCVHSGVARTSYPSLAIWTIPEPFHAVPYRSSYRLCRFCQSVQSSLRARCWTYSHTKCTAEVR
jgi:hypothetical protein